MSMGLKMLRTFEYDVYRLPSGKIIEDDRRLCGIGDDCPRSGCVCFARSQGEFIETKKVEYD